MDDLLRSAGLDRARSVEEACRLVAAVRGRPLDVVEDVDELVRDDVVAVRPGQGLAGVDEDEVALGEGEPEPGHAGAEVALDDLERPAAHRRDQAARLLDAAGAVQARGAQQVIHGRRPGRAGSREEGAPGVARGRRSR